ncbi:hypothetical protein T190_31350 [Sinorhizobium meliloti CCBAU 01290]|nr:hypothetical protein T190_31350 [Sinorhizobium meliloti CCBAU 01290]
MKKKIRAISVFAAAFTVAVPTFMTFARAENGATFRMIVQEPRFMDPIVSMTVGLPSKLNYSSLLRRSEKTGRLSIYRRNQLIGPATG